MDDHHKNTPFLGRTVCGPALAFTIQANCASSGFARCGLLELPHGSVESPVFMPVGTHGCIKGVTAEQMYSEPISCGLLLANTYHLALKPGAEAIKRLGGIHHFMGWKGNLLTDSGGFQMVSLLSLANITEQGVEFQSPTDGTKMLLTPEESIRTQHCIGSDIIMALDDVVHSCTNDDARFLEATDRTVRWLDRCIAEHERANSLTEQDQPHLRFPMGPSHQNLFAIVQGGLDVREDGLRKRCLDAFLERDSKIPGYAIGGLAGGESKDDFWRVVAFCTKRLPYGKPRYVMGIGYPLDIVVCSALGVDMFDSVYPTRTARFGTALTFRGTLRIKSGSVEDESSFIEENCPCRVCCGPDAVTRAHLHRLLKSQDSLLGASLITHHNLTFMMRLGREIRTSLKENRFPEFVRHFLMQQYVQPCPQWAIDALAYAGIVV